MELQKDIDDLQEEIKKASYFPLVEDIVNIIEKKTGNNSHTYFRVVTSFFLAQIASCMRCQIKGETFDNVPVNIFEIKTCTVTFNFVVCDETILIT